ncbi:MAG: sugar phosphate isomerase/epimerase family protein [Oscillospiraceae bacterium]|nr:sugar phosphate isomerase/epimerase family protein [Oscillospiraceae bacterium]
MNKIGFYAFADESSGYIDDQIVALKKNGYDGVEMRTVDEESISDISIEKAKEVKKKFDDAGLKVWSLGSPLGKIDIEKDEFAPHIEKVKHTIELANILGSENIRMFSFYIPKGSDPANYRNEVMDRLSQMVELAKGTGVTLCHENEKGIYGDTAERCLDILEHVSGLGAIYDPANFIQCGVDTKKAWELLGSRIKYMHIKDADEDNKVVPPGEGIGSIEYIVGEFIKGGGNAFTVEPHLYEFTALKSLEREGEESNVGSFRFASKPEAFDYACQTFKAIVEKVTK